MSQETDYQETEYLVVGTTPDTTDLLEPGDRLVLDGLAVEPDGEGYKVLADESAVLGPTDGEADTVEALVEWSMGATGDGRVEVRKEPEGHAAVTAPSKTLMERFKGVFMKDDDKTLGEGRGVGGPLQGIGGADTCVCPECGHEEKHERGRPCAEVQCPKCGEPMRGKEEEEQKALADWADELGEEGYKALLSHLAETERLTEEEAALLAADELKGLIENWIETGDKAAAAGRWVTIRGKPVFIEGGASETQEVREGISALKSDKTEVANGKTLYELVKEHGPVDSMFDVRERGGLFEVHQTRDSLFGLAGSMGSRHATAELAKKGRKKAIREREGHLADLVSKYVPKAVHFTDKEKVAADMIKEVTGTKSYSELESSKAGRRISGEKLNLLREVKEGFDNLMERIKELIGWGEYADRVETMPDDWASLMGGSKSGFKSFKGKDDKWRWVSWCASAFEDREREFFKQKALETYVAETYKRGDHGKLWFYHLPLGLGDGDFTALCDKILLKMGTWADDPHAQKAAEYFHEHGEEWGASVGYKYKAGDRDDKVYDWLWVFEVSPVPKTKAAFPFSRFDSVLGGPQKMDVNEDQKATLEAVFGPSWPEVLERVESASKQLEQAGLAFKMLGGEGDETSALLGQVLADEIFAEKAKADPVQMLKLALGKIKDAAAKGLVEKVIAVLEKYEKPKKEGYEYPKPGKKAKKKDEDEEEEEYGKPKEEKAEDKGEECEEYEKPKKKGKKDMDPETLPIQLEVEGLTELVDAVKTMRGTITQQAEQIAQLQAMVEAGDEGRVAQKIAKAAPIVAYKASIAGLLDEDKKEGDQPQATKMKADHPLAIMAAGTPLGPRGG